MARNKSQQLIIDNRRQQVARLRRQRLILRQIAHHLAEDDEVNPDTGKPWDVATIKRDLDALTREVRAAAVRDVSHHKAEILAEYQALLSIHWAEGEHENVRRVLKDARELLGTDAPTVIIFEQVQQRMNEVYSSLKEEFGGDPETWTRIVRTLLGGRSHKRPPTRGTDQLN